ncbi:MAG: hypothetical protein ACOZNI_34900 [Myxococcota bacterium]
MTALRDQLRVKLGAAYDADVPGLDAASPERGAETFRKLCVPCCQGPPELTAVGAAKLIR